MIRFAVTPARFLRLLCGVRRARVLRGVFGGLVVLVFGCPLLCLFHCFVVHLLVSSAAPVSSAFSVFLCSRSFRA